MNRAIARFRRQGFTLIELLIVVAIIAILAAIAVPNFLEAQTRAKVSRVRSDQRTIGLGLESYFVDYSKYPNSSLFIGESNQTVPWQIQPVFRWATVGGLIELTTPISYLTRYPPDVFDIKAPWTSSPVQNRETMNRLDRPYDS
ncbi:MAG TPA: prepilin-type N-terminal cleavage/methylation domain-containing protein [Candidatus Sumerlaeota bacterium]|nr:prepilin-type N-terminal cleavage/methylation domain-containing protein [Candidatus Sumerlaeota bacterium]